MKIEVLNLGHDEIKLKLEPETENEKEWTAEVEKKSKYLTGSVYFNGSTKEKAMISVFYSTYTY